MTQIWIPYAEVTENWEYLTIPHQHYWNGRKTKPFQGKEGLELSKGIYVECRYPTGTQTYYEAVTFEKLENGSYVVDCSSVSDELWKTCIGIFVTFLGIENELGRIS